MGASSAQRLLSRFTSIFMFSNNYLGLADHPDVIAAAKAGPRSMGFGMASVRFICGGTAWPRAALRGKAQEPPPGYGAQNKAADASAAVHGR